MTLSEMHWSKAEKDAARRAFERAYRKECARHRSQEHPLQPFLLNLAPARKEAPPVRAQESASLLSEQNPVESLFSAARVSIQCFCGAGRFPKS